MHIPDGFLNIGISALAFAITILFWILSFGKAKKIMGDKHIPLLAVLAAAIFAGQMINFTLVGVGGTSGHLLGAALAAIILGPYGAIIIMTLVLTVQALFFADGGILALGANILLMGIAGGFTAYPTYHLLKRRMKNNTIPAFFAGWLSVVVASIVCSLMLGLSGTIPTSKALLAMVPIHAIIGVGEGLITVGVLSFIKKTRPDLLRLKKITPRSWFK